MREMDTYEYVTALRQLVQEGHEVCTRISGGSMAPFLVHRRDMIFFRSPCRPLKPGDMVFYQRRSGHYVMHRIYKIKNGGYYLAGDAQTVIEGPLDRDQIFGLVTRVRRKGKLIGPGNFWWFFFAQVWRRILPLRPYVLALYSRLVPVRKDA